MNAPWTDEQVKALNKYQKERFMHPFTCPNDHDNRELVATNNGWICKYCDYRQDWCHDWMADTDKHPIFGGWLK